MTYEVKWTGKFKKSFKLAKKRGLDLSLPNVVLYGSILFVCILVPQMIYHFSNKGTVLERLRIDEN